MSKLKIGDIVTNEYGNTGKLIEINSVDEAIVEVYNYGIKHDIDYCSYKLCRLATEKEIINSFNTNNK